LAFRFVLFFCFLVISFRLVRLCECRCHFCSHRVTLGKLWGSRQSLFFFSRGIFLGFKDAGQLKIFLSVQLLICKTHPKQNPLVVLKDFCAIQLSRFSRNVSCCTIEFCFESQQENAHGCQVFFA
jgi:hypothetical protein